MVIFNERHKASKQQHCHCCDDNLMPLFLCLLSDLITKKQTVATVTLKGALANLISTCK